VVAEPVGEVTGTMAVRGGELSGTFETSSPRLNVSGTGRIAMTAKADAELTFQVHDSSLDPYVRLFVPKLSEHTTAVATGSIRVSGELADFEHLHVEGTVDSLDMQLFDYAVRNAGPVRLALEQNVVRINQLELVGDGTRLRIDGTIGLQDRRIALRASGDADLRVLQDFEPDVRGSGRAELSASVNGPLDDPQFFGSATITNGSVRYSALPNALDAINGVLRFDSRSIRLDDLTARMGGGLVQFGGVVGLEGYVPGDLNVIVRGENVNLRVPQGVRSTVDAELAVHGNIQAPTLAGTVLVKNAIWNRDIDPSGGILKFGGDEVAAAAAGAVPATFAPVRLDVHLLIPSTLRIENNLMRLVANADLQLRGTTERPAIFGRAEVERGEIEFEGRRYLVTNGSVDFTNPNRIEPFFDFEAETRVRIPGQTYRVTIRVTGTSAGKLTPTFESDPPLPSADVVAILFGDVRRTQGPDVELRALQNPNEREADILTTRLTQAVATRISDPVGRVVEQTFGLDTFQLSPSLIDPTSSGANRVNPSARVTIGKRVSDRVFLTFSRSLTSSINDQILLLEYDASERLSWILSRNEDQTYAIEVRVRHTF
jgi:translocation and assembly module TamB